MSDISLLEQSFSIDEQKEELAPLLKKLQKTRSLEERLKAVSSASRVKEFFKKQNFLSSYVKALSDERALVLKSLVAVGQGERILGEAPLNEDNLHKLIEILLPVERFYHEIGGIVGYHNAVLHFLSVKKEESISPHNSVYHPPEGVDISEENLSVRQALVWGLERMEEMAEIYPVGGAADRLRLHDEQTAAALPAAKLIFGGRTLLEGMVVDLQAREYLHYKLYGKQLITPLAMMTSQEKDNHAQILSICEEKRWFGRPKSSFRFFSQPSVPCVNRKGEWCLVGPMQLLLKPGGHGVIWKLARDAKIFDWLYEQGRRKALIRQINNPIAGSDYGLLAFTGLGCQGDKIFGFASCPRKRGAAEGINVLLEKRRASGVEYVLTNVEYCDFEKYRQVELAPQEKETRGGFSSNTNILFIDLKAVEKAVELTPLPGILINPKKTAYRTEKGIVEEEVARLESTMQNIADCFGHTFARPLPAGKRAGEMRTFLTYNSRAKTISTVKREETPGAPLLETPAGCFFDAQKNARALLAQVCKMQLDEEKALPLFFYHPSLGPLYSIIAQKIRGGHLEQKSELSLEIAELDMENMRLDGSLLITALALMGTKNKDGVLHYSDSVGKCVLKNVLVKNAGIDRSLPSVFWKREIFRKESCQIVIDGDGEFYAEDITLKGDHLFKVESGTRLTVTQHKGKLVEKREVLKKAIALWKYQVAPDYRIVLTRN